MFYMTQAAIDHLGEGSAIIQLHVGDHVPRLAEAARLQRDQRARSPPSPARWRRTWLARRSG
jgi:hypothetical protein